MLVKIKRQKDADSAPYWQTFSVDADPDMTVSAMLDRLNYTDDLYDAEGVAAPRIRWECSCSQKMCGACAMVINGVPKLACAAFLRDEKRDVLTLEPLSKFPVVADLIVDRSIISENLQKAQAYLGTYRPLRKKDFEQMYAAAKCLKCGLCLEVCPNYSKGEHFFGALFANEAARSLPCRAKIVPNRFAKPMISTLPRAAPRRFPASASARWRLTRSPLWRG